MLKPLLFALIAACALPLHAQERSTGAGPDQLDAQAVAAERVARNYHQRIAVILAQGGQPRDLALAATLRELADAGQDAPDDATAMAWRARAAENADNDVLTNALLMTGAGRAGDARLAAHRWSAQEPDNIAPLLFGGDGVDELLDNADRFRRFDLHMYDQVRWIQSALLRNPPSDAERRVLMEGDSVPLEEYAAASAMGLWGAVAMPSLELLAQACEQPARRTACAQVARVMAQESDGNLGSMLGIDLLQRVAATASERIEADALRRRMDWQMIEWGRVAAGQPRGGLPQFVRLLQDPQVRTEHDLVERILGEAGVPLDPPAGWQAPRFQGQAPVRDY